MNNKKKGNQNARKYPDEWIDTFISEFQKGKTTQKISEDSTIHIATLENWKRQYITCSKSWDNRQLIKDFIEQYFETGCNYSETARRIGVDRSTVKRMRMKYLPEIDLWQQFTKLEIIGMFTDNEIAYYLKKTPHEVKTLRAKRNRILKIASGETQCGKSDISPTNGRNI